MDAPEPQWKYLSGFAIQKGHPKARTTGPLRDLLTPRRGPTTAPPLATTTEGLITQQPLPITNQNNEDVVPNGDEPPTMVAQAPPTQHVAEQGPQNNAIRQTCSGQVVTNTSWYNQSIT